MNRCTLSNHWREPDRGIVYVTTFCVYYALPNLFKLVFPGNAKKEEGKTCSMKRSQVYSLLKVHFMPLYWCLSIVINETLCQNLIDPSLAIYVVDSNPMEHDEV